MPQEYDIPELQDDELPTTSDVLLTGLAAANASIQFCNSMLHEPLRAIAEILWDEECRKPMAGADIMLIDRDDIRRGWPDGGLYYIPKELQTDMHAQHEEGDVDTNLDAGIVAKGCALKRIVAEPVVLDLHMLKFANAKLQNDDLRIKLSEAVGSIVKELRAAGQGKTAVATMPEMSVTHGETPIQVIVHTYGLIGVMPLAEA